MEVTNVLIGVGFFALSIVLIGVIAATYGSGVGALWRYARSRTSLIGGIGAHLVLLVAVLPLWLVPVLLFMEAIIGRFGNSTTAGAESVPQIIVTALTGVTGLISGTISAWRAGRTVRPSRADEIIELDEASLSKVAGGFASPGHSFSQSAYSDMRETSEISNADKPPRFRDKSDGDLQGVYFATDRQREDLAFANERASNGEVSVGYCDVVIPKHHRIGNLELPRRRFFGSITERFDPSRHFYVKTFDVLTEEVYFNSLESELVNNRRELLLFVHGYNVTFANAVLRTAQLAYDLDFLGPAVAWSWPSRGAMGDYVIDENNIEWTKPHLRSFLRQLSSLPALDRIHVIAHSMGNRAVANAIAELAQIGIPTKLHTLVLAAPDIDREIFLQLADHLTSEAKDVTLYASTRDRALQASMAVNGYPRAGDARTPVLCPHVTTIDASAVDTDFLGHGYFSATRTVVTDMSFFVECRHLAQDCNGRAALTGSCG